MARASLGHIMIHESATVLRHLRVDSYDPDETAYIMDQLVPAADEAAQAFINRNVYGTADELASAVLAGTAGDSPMVATRAYRQAVLLTVGHFYRNREDVVGVQTFKLPIGSHALLWPLRAGLGV